MVRPPPLTPSHRLDGAPGPGDPGVSEASTIARELAELGSRLADLSRRVEKLEGAEVDSGPSAGASLLSAREVVERTGLSRGTVYRLGRQGELGAVRVGERGVRFSAGGLDAWLRRGGSR